MVLMIIGKTIRAFFTSFFFKKFIFYAGYYVQLRTVSTLFNLFSFSKEQFNKFKHENIRLISNIYIFKLPKVKQKKIYYTRNKVKRLREIISNGKILQAILNNTAIKVIGQIPKEIRETLVKEFNLHIINKSNSNFTMILPL